MEPSKKVVSTVESSEDHSVQGENGEDDGDGRGVSSASCSGELSIGGDSS